MNSDITGFRIAGLHGRRDVNIPIEENCVVLVGVNGLGKTTIINLFHYLLTRQWVRLLEYQFEALAIEIGGDSLSITREQIEGPIHNSRWRRRIARLHPRFAALLEEHPHLLASVATAPPDSLLLRTLAEEQGLPFSMLMELRLSFGEEPLQQELFASASGVKEFEGQMAGRLHGRVLYLPTYRRIERDLEKLFPSLAEQISRQRAPRIAGEAAYLELVEFGMKDVEKRFTELLTGFEKRARSEMNTLAASYLGEVIRGEADTYDISLIASLDDDAIGRILNRVEERDILNAPDKETLRKVIARLRTTGGQIGPQEKYVGHFFSKLAAIHKSLAQAEAAVEEFVAVCNNYLVEKRVVFDDKKYTISIHQQSGETPLELRHLSSGEKQIVSLFTHVYLGETGDLLVLIDEPELSLSVPWQKQLLPDIRRSGRCRFLAAVTHSPFIYDNELRARATDLRQCISDR